MNYGIGIEECGMSQASARDSAFSALHGIFQECPHDIYLYGSMARGEPFYDVDVWMIEGGESSWTPPITILGKPSSSSVRRASCPMAGTPEKFDEIAALSLAAYK